MKRIMTIICALALIAVTLLAVTLNTWLNAKSGQLVSAEREINELTSLINRLNEDVELIEAANARLSSDLEESQSMLSAKDREIYSLTEELNNTRTALSAALGVSVETQSALSSGEDSEAQRDNLEAAYNEGSDNNNNPPPDKQAISTAIETTRADIKKLSARLDSEIPVKGVQAAVGEAISATQATLDELAAQYENAPMGEDMQRAIAEAISSTQASIDNLTIRLNNSFTANDIQAAVAETIASTQAIFDELTSHLEH